jgi:hypothetical protein
LESECTFIAYRGFESRPLRQFRSYVIEFKKIIK